MTRSVNPYTGALLYEFNNLTTQKLEAGIHLSEQAFHRWRKVPLEKRCQRVETLAVVLERNREFYARTMTLEMGKPIAQARAEIDKCAWLCRYYAENASEHLAERKVVTDARQSYVRYDPLGPVLGIMPWNYPFWQVFRFAVPTVLAGNSALLKHASNVWKCAEHIRDAFLEAGFPEGVFQHLPVGSNLVSQILKHPLVRAVSLTGSAQAGRAVAETAGHHIKKSVLELGGSNALVVFEDADLEQTVATCIQARFQNTGQSCIAGKRLLLQRSIAPEFMDRLASGIRALQSGDPREEETYIGVLARPDLAEALDTQLQNALGKGAELVCGGKRDGAYFEPTLVANVRPDMLVFREETFGPLLAVTLFDREAEAIRLSNASVYGLGVSLFTGSTERAQRLIPVLDEGAVFVNALVKSDPRLPFGGIKESGYGRELAGDGIREFVNTKTVYWAT